MKHRLFQKFPARYQTRKERSLLHYSGYPPSNSHQGGEEEEDRSREE